MGIERLEDRIDQIQTHIAQQYWGTAAKESVSIIELAFRELYQRSLGMLSGPARRRVFSAEDDIGGGNKTVDNFTMGQLVALYRQSRFLDAWAESTGSNLRGLRVINLDELVRLRNALVHEEHVANRSEAELLFGCLQSILETFGILTLETPSGLASVSSPSAPAVSLPAGAAEVPSAARRRSAYSPRGAGEQDRLHIQAEATRAFDLELFELANQHRTRNGLIGLDIGCASGEVTVDRFTRAAGFSSVLAVDCDEGCISAARGRSGDDGPVDFLHADAEDLEFPAFIKAWLQEQDAIGFDIAFSALTLHHFANPIRLLRTIRYCLAPGGSMIVRGADDGTKVAYPDTENRVNRLVDLTVQQPRASDRLHGRKLYYWLYRAGFRDVELRFSAKTTVGRSLVERNRIFQESFAYRSNYFKDLDADGAPQDDRQRQRSEMVQHLEELEVEFEDDGFCYWELDVGAIAHVP